MADTKVIVDCSTGEEEVVDLDPDEKAQLDADRVVWAEEAAAEVKAPSLVDEVAALKAAIVKSSDFAAMKAELAKADVAAPEAKQAPKK